MLISFRNTSPVPYWGLIMQNVKSIEWTKLGKVIIMYCHCKNDQKESVEFAYVILRQSIGKRKAHLQNPGSPHNKVKWDDYYTDN